MPHFYAWTIAFVHQTLSTQHCVLCWFIFLLHRAGELHLMHWTWNREKLWYFLALHTECFPAGTALQGLSAEGHLLRDGNPLGQHMSSLWRTAPTSQRSTHQGYEQTTRVQPCNGKRAHSSQLLLQSFDGWFGKEPGIKNCILSFQDRIIILHFSWIHEKLFAQLALSTCEIFHLHHPLIRTLCAALSLYTSAAPKGSGTFPISLIDQRNRFIVSFGLGNQLMY